MNYLLQWYQVYKTEGLNDLSPEIKASINEYKKEVDSVGTFLDTLCIKTGKDGDRLSTVELWNLHNEFCKENQHLQPNKFAHRLKSLGCDVRRRDVGGTKKTCISGYVLNSDVLAELQKESAITDSLDRQNT